MNKKIWIPIAAAVVLIAAGIAGWRWLYFGQLTEQKIKVFSKVPLPAAFVSASGVPMKEVLERKDLAEAVYGRQEENTDLTLITQILDQLIVNTQLKKVAATRKIIVTPNEVDQEYQAIVNQATGGDMAAFEKSLSDSYGLTTADFKSKVVNQELLNNKLRAWYNGQQDLNGKEYTTIKDIQNQLAEGKQFTDLAKSYSQDESTKQFGGDAGTTALNKLLPELQQSLRDAKAEEIKLVSSRYGIHLIKIIERSGEGSEVQLHLQQIFIETQGYEAWYEDQIKGIKVVRLLHFS